MTKREEVIREFERFMQEYSRDIGYTNYDEEVLKGVLALLKVQKLIEPEPKEVIYDDEHRSVYCPSCDNRLAGLTYSGAVALETEETPNYCWMCGQVVKW